jgi:hypothetical protein
LISLSDVCKVFLWQSWDGHALYEQDGSHAFESQSHKSCFCGESSGEDASNEVGGFRTDELVDGHSF